MQIQIRPSLPSVGHMNHYHMLTVHEAPTGLSLLPESTMSLSLFGDFIPSNPDPDLLVGFITIIAACTPYVLALIFPTFINEEFFLPVYEDTEDGREAEIGWKVRYTTLALLLTSLTAGEVLFFPDRGSVAILRDSYLLWALFNTEATRKIRWEAKNRILKVKNRFGIQLWHSIVVLILWADVSASPTAAFITDFLKNVFT